MPGVGTLSNSGVSGDGLPVVRRAHRIATLAPRPSLILAEFEPFDSSFEPIDADDDVADEDAVA